MMTTHVFASLFITLMMCGLIFGEIGDLTVRKASPLVLNAWKHEECERLLPHSARCDNAYKVIDEYCEDQAKKIDKECDDNFSKLKTSCNEAETKIKDECKESDGYVTAKCGKQFDRLEKVCKIASETISRSCTRRYKRMDKICDGKYKKNDFKCKRINKQHEDLCESNLELSTKYDMETKEEDEIEGVEEKVEQVISLETDVNDYVEKKAEIAKPTPPKASPVKPVPANPAPAKSTPTQPKAPQPKVPIKKFVRRSFFEEYPNEANFERRASPYTNVGVKNTQINNLSKRKEGLNRRPLYEYFEDDYDIKVKGAPTQKMVRIEKKSKGAPAKDTPVKPVPVKQVKPNKIPIGKSFLDEFIETINY